MSDPTHENAGRTGKNAASDVLLFLNFLWYCFRGCGILVLKIDLTKEPE
jgi:hypothetical protein